MMVLYRRNRIQGGTYFFTLTLKNRQSTLLVDHIAELREAFRRVNLRYPFQTDAIVILPEHIHAIFTLPAGDANYSSRWRLIKSVFTRLLIRKKIPLKKNKYGEYDLWQRRFWEHTITNDVDMARHIDYIHFNPVKHCYVARVIDWPYSSFHRYVKNGILPADWACSDLDFDAGE